MISLFAIFPPPVLIHVHRYDGIIRPLPPRSHTHTDTHIHQNQIHLKKGGNGKKRKKKQEGRKEKKAKNVSTAHPWVGTAVDYFVVTVQRKSPAECTGK